MLESDDTPTSEDSSAPPGDGEDRALTPEQKQSAIADLLDPKKPEGDKPDGDKAPSGEDQDKGGKLDSLDAVAEKLGVEVSSLYDIAIPQPGSGEDRVTLGQLADMAKDSGQLELDRLEFDERVQKREADLARAQQEINEIVSLLPKHAIKDDLVNAVGKKIAAAQAKERGLTLLAIPTWKDEQAEEADREAMTAHLTPYGFAANYLDSVQDHRTLKYIRDNMQRENNVKRALEAVRRKRPDGQKPGKKAAAPKKPGKPATPQRGPLGRAAQAEAVAELIRNN